MSSITDKTLVVKKAQDELARYDCPMTINQHYSDERNPIRRMNKMVLDSGRISIWLLKNGGEATTTFLHKELGFNRHSVQCLERNLKDKCPFEVIRNVNIYDGNGNLVDIHYRVYLKEDSTPEKLALLIPNLKKEDKDRR